MVRLARAEVFDPNEVAGSRKRWITEKVSGTVYYELADSVPGTFSATPS